MIVESVTTADLEPGDIVAGHGTVARVLSVRPADNPGRMRGMRRVEFTNGTAVPMADVGRRWHLEQPPPTYSYPVRTRVTLDIAPGKPDEPTVWTITDGRHQGFAVENGPEQVDVVAIGEDGHGVYLGRALYPMFAGQRFARHFGCEDPQISAPVRNRT